MYLTNKQITYWYYYEGRDLTSRGLRMSRRRKRRLADYEKNVNGTKFSCSSAHRINSQGDSKGLGETEAKGRANNDTICENGVDRSSCGVRYVAFQSQ